MKKIIKYQSKDGINFNTEEECIKYEDILDQVNTILDILPDREKYDKDCSFSNGGGYLQLPKNTKEKIEKSLVKLSNIWFKPSTPFEKFNFILGRYIDDSNMKCLNNLSFRLMCIKDDREYGQPYYAINPDKCENIKLN